MFNRILSSNYLQVLVSFSHNLNESMNRLVMNYNNFNIHNQKLIDNEINL